MTQRNKLAHLAGIVARVRRGADRVFRGRRREHHAGRFHARPAIGRSRSKRSGKGGAWSARCERDTGLR